MNTHSPKMTNSHVVDVDRPRTGPRGERRGVSTLNRAGGPRPAPYQEKQRVERSHQTTSLASFGGQHCQTIGTSTTDISDEQDNQQRLNDFNAELERVCYGVQAGREW